jgi:glutamyl-tRNA synthetase
MPQYSSETLTRLVPTIRERINTLTEFKTEVDNGEYDFAFTAPNYDVEILKWKNDTSVAEARPRLVQALELLKNADFNSPETIKASLWEYAEEIGKGELLWPLRVCLSGKAQSPDPFTLAYIIGQVETLSRITTACDKIGE